MNQAQLTNLAAVIKTIRNDWQLPGIKSQLNQLHQTWTGTDAELAAHVTNIAANPQAQTPGAFNAAMPASAKTTQPTDPELKEPTCYICSRPKSKCEQMQDWEIEHQRPSGPTLDPHAFETAEQAEANATPLTPQRKTEIMSRISTVFQNVNDLPGMKHAVETAKLAEEREQAKT